MHATIQLHAEDLAAARRYAYARSRLHSTFALVMISVTMLTFLVQPADMALNDKIAWTILWGPFVVTMYTAALYWVVERRARQADADELGEASVEIEGTTLAEKRPSRTRTWSLDRVQQVSATKDHLLVDMGGDVLVLPSWLASVHGVAESQVAVGQLVGGQADVLVLGGRSMICEVADDGSVLAVNFR